MTDLRMMLINNSIYHWVLLLGVIIVLALHLNIAFNPLLSLKLNSPRQPKCDTPHRNIAYFIQISESNVEMLPRLLSVLGTESDDIVLHFDSRIKRKVVSQYYPTNSSARVTLLEPRHYLGWGDI